MLVIWLVLEFYVHDKLQRLCHQCNKDVLGFTEACDFNCGVLFSRVFIHHSVLYPNNVCLWHLELRMQRLGAWFSVCLLPCPLGTVLSPCPSAALHMASVVGGVTEGWRGQGRAGKGPGIFTNVVKVLNDEERALRGGQNSRNERNLSLHFWETNTRTQAHMHSLNL